MKGLFASAALAACFLPFVALAQTPGQINDPSTYRGSMANQQAEQASADQVAAQNQAMQQRLDQNYAGYANNRGGGGGGGGQGVKPLKSYPLLPAAKNPLIGMWRMGQTKPMAMNPLLKGLGADTFVNGAMGGACEQTLGKPGTVIRFTPTQLNWVAPDGHDEVLNHVEYRANGDDVIVIPSDGDLAFIFGMSNHDNAVAAVFGCTLSRTNTAARTGPGTVAGAGPGARSVPVPGAGGQAILNLTVGEMIDGRLSAPPAGTRLYLTNQNPDASLARAGFAPPAGADAMDGLFNACKIGQGGTQERCNAGLTALTTGAIGAVDTDANGHAATGAVAPGRYYVVGFTPYKGHSLIWHLPVDLKPGANAVSLTPQNGSVSH